MRFDYLNPVGDIMSLVTKSSRKSCLLLFIATTICMRTGVLASCGFPGAPAHSTVQFSQGTVLDTNRVDTGAIAEYTCDRGFELLGPVRRVCSRNGTWSPEGIPFCVLNVAAGKAPMQSSVAEGGIPQKAVDGSTSTIFDLRTCSLTEVEKAPWWYVNLLEPYMVQLVRIDFGQSCCAKGRQATIVVRVGNNRPDLGVNPICNRFTGVIEEGRPLFLPCNPPMPGAFVSVHFEGPPGVSLSICEAFVYTDQALPIERCPTFRDQRPGSTATYNGKCYIFYNQQPRDYMEALDFCKERGGSLVDESNPALQGFLSWELWRRHRGDSDGQYWLGANRDPMDPKNWKWISGKSVTVSFWNLPGGNENCARFDGTKGWLWSDTDCDQKLHYICQHRPTTCGKPEQPPNSTLVAGDFNVGSRIEYLCDEGHLLVGPAKRNCLPTGFYSEFPPVCRYLECGPPMEISNGRMEYLNGTREFKSVIEYRCDAGFLLVGRNQLMCDVDQRWNGPPPRCEPVYCEEPKPIRYGGFTLSTNSTRFGTVVTYYCTSARHQLVGPKKITCLKDGSYNADPPSCQEINKKSSPPLVAVENERIDSADTLKPFDVKPPMMGGGFNEKTAADMDKDGDVSKEEEEVKQDILAENNDDDSVMRVGVTADGKLKYRRRRPFNQRKGAGGGRYGNRPYLFSSTSETPETEQYPVKPSVIEESYDPLDSLPRAPINNEIPDSANVQNDRAGADLPSLTETKNEATAQLNLGGIIALGVFGGFVFLAAIITTIVILIRRKEKPDLEDQLQPRSHHHSSRHKEQAEGEVDREHSELVVASHSKHHRHHHHRHHHHHHHHGKQGGRHHNHSSSSGEESRHQSSSKHGRY